jgi:AcrR family transcriptional regulator
VPTSTPSALATRTRARDQVLAAARTRFLADGVRATTMEDVAREAGVSRQLVYKLFLGRRELVEAAVSARTTEIADAIAEEYDIEALRRASDLAETFVAVSVAVIERLRSDPELGVLLAPGSPVTLHEALWSEELTERGERFWLPLLEQARALKLLRADLSLSELSDWLRTVYTSMILRPDLDPDAERDAIQRFVRTSLSMVIQTKKP